MSRYVTHRWNLPEGQNPPCVGDTVLGRTTRHHWRVVEVRPVESRKHPNAYAARMEPLGEWDEARWDDDQHVPGLWRYTPPRGDEAAA